MHSKQDPVQGDVVRGDPDGFRGHKVPWHYRILGVRGGFFQVSTSDCSSWQSRRRPIAKGVHVSGLGPISGGIFPSCLGEDLCGCWFGKFALPVLVLGVCLKVRMYFDIVSRG